MHSALALEQLNRPGLPEAISLESRPEALAGRTHVCLALLMPLRKALAFLRLV